MPALLQLWDDQWRSYRSLPVWVQLWVGWLVAINLVGAADGSTPTGRATRRATYVFLPINAALVIAERGYSSALSFSHLVAWPPLVVQLFRRSRSADCGAAERRIATLVGLTNALSIAFDTIDATRWIKGDRAVAGSVADPLDAT